MNPSDLRYSRSHEWAKLDKASGVVTVGITEFAVKQLGDIVFLELPGAGAKVAKDAAFGVIESVKAAVDLNSPVSGKVADSNLALSDKLDQLAKDPYGGGWMLKVQASAPAELDALMTAAQYEEFLKSEGAH